MKLFGQRVHTRPDGDIHPIRTGRQGTSDDARFRDERTVIRLV